MSARLHPTSQHQLDAIQPGASASYLLHGPSIETVREAARELTRRLNCTGDQPAQCANCRRLAADAFADYLTLTPGDKPSIGIEATRERLKTLELRPAAGHVTRMLVITPADLLTTEAQNTLLKVAEEPPPRTVLVFATTRPQALLPTIRSRAAAILVQTAGASASDDNLDAAAAAWLELRPFERLIKAKQLAEGGLDLLEFSGALQGHIVKQLADATAATTVRRQVAALERFRQQIASGVTARTSLERLVLSL